MKINRSCKQVFTFAVEASCLLAELLVEMALEAVKVLIAVWFWRPVLRALLSELKTWPLPWQLALLAVVLGKTAVSVLH